MSQLLTISIFGSDTETADVSVWYRWGGFTTEAVNKTNTILTTLADASSGMMDKIFALESTGATVTSREYFNDSEELVGLTIPLDNDAHDGIIVIDPADIYDATINACLYVEIHLDTREVIFECMNLVTKDEYLSDIGSYETPYDDLPLYPYSEELVDLTMDNFYKGTEELCNPIGSYTYRLHTGDVIQLVTC